MVAPCATILFAFSVCTPIGRQENKRNAENSCGEQEQKKAAGPKRFFIFHYYHQRVIRDLWSTQRLQLIMTAQQQQRILEGFYILQMSSSLAVSRFVCLLHIAVKNRSAVPSIKQMTFLGRIGWLLLYMREEK